MICSGPRKVHAHQNGHRHADQDGRQGQHDVLDTDDLMIKAEDVFANEAGRWLVPVHAFMSLRHLSLS
jgi:hypothetical protein